MNRPPKQVATQVQAVVELMRLSSALVRPPPALLPAEPRFEREPATLAIDAAQSATAIAHAVATLGTPGQDSEVAAKIIWHETLAQIARIQRLRGLPSLPFQNNLPGGPQSG